MCAHKTHTRRREKCPGEPTPGPLVDRKYCLGLMVTLIILFRRCCLIPFPLCTALKHSLSCLQRSGPARCAGGWKCGPTASSQRSQGACVDHACPIAEQRGRQRQVQTVWRRARPWHRRSEGRGSRPAVTTSREQGRRRESTSPQSVSSGWCWGKVASGDDSELEVELEVEPHTGSRANPESQAWASDCDTKPPSGTVDLVTAVKHSGPCVCSGAALQHGQRVLRPAARDANQLRHGVAVPACFCGHWQFRLDCAGLLASSPAGNDGRGWW